MSLNDEILAGFDEAEIFMSESFTLSNHTGDFTGIFRGENAPTDHSMIEGYDTETTDTLSANKAQFDTPPMVNETLTKSTGQRYVVTMVEDGDNASWNLELRRLDV